MIAAKQIQELYKIKPTKAPILKVLDLENQCERTLIFGFTGDSETHHVYIQDGEIHVVRYFHNGELREINVVCNEDFIPNKRIYPTRSDFDFCAKLCSLGLDMTFTSCDESELSRTFGKYLGRTIP